MLSDLWPAYAIVLTTPRLVLRLPDEAELAALAELAAAGVHEPGERPFLTPWTEGTPQERARSVLRAHWGRLASWEPDSWALGLAVFERGSGTVIGQVTLRARDFAVTGEVTTGSWLGLAHHRQGYGTEARTAILTLAFDHLGASDATSEVFPDNAASQGVSRRLGYQPDGISRDRRGDEVVLSDRLRLTRERWDGRGDKVPVEITGVEAARALFG